MWTTSLPGTLMTGRNRTRRAPCKLLHCATIFAIMLFNHSEIILLSLMADGKGKPTHMVLFGKETWDRGNHHKAHTYLKSDSQSH